jgi:hypothetical protein
MQRLAPFLAAIAIAGCVPREDLPGLGGGAEAALRDDGACDPMRLVGELAAGTSCPTASAGWTGEPLFRTRSPVLSQLGTGYCLYRYTGDPGLFSRTGLPRDGIRTPDEWLEEDCHVVVGLSDDGVVESLVDDYHAAYREQMDALATLPLTPAFVEVALIDTSPDSVGTSGQPTTDVDNIHGRAVGMAIRDLTCPTGSGCIVQFHSYEGLRGDGRDYVTHLARTVSRAVDERRTDLGGRLIINLSIGYHPMYAVYEDGGDISPWRVTTRALMAALNYARCTGAITIAAAGNTEDGPEPDGEPMYPGAFDAYANGWTCNSAHLPVAEPIVFAASGVDGLDRDLPNARADGRAPLVAPAFAVTVPNGSIVLSPMTGSSFAAAGTTAAAALVWAYRPTLGWQSVMSTVRDGAVPTTLQPSTPFCDHPPCDPVRRVSICGSVERALYARCQLGEPAACTAWRSLHCTAGPAGLVRIPAHALDGFPHTIITPIYQAESNPTDICGWDPSTLETVVLEEELAIDERLICPDFVWPNGIVRDTTGPQPGDRPCRACAIASGHPEIPHPTYLVMDLDPEWFGLITNPAVTVGNYHFVLDPAFLEDQESFGNVIKIELPNLPEVAVNTPAKLTFATLDQGSVVESLPIWE